jgi:ankyrin repeat protein
MDQTNSDLIGEQFISACASGDTKVIIDFLERGIDPNYQSKYGQTGLWMACSHEQLAVVQILLECPGININLKNLSGNTPLLKCKFQSSHIKIIRMLLARSELDINVVNDRGEYPLLLASGGSPDGDVMVMKLLLEDPRLDTTVRYSNKSGQMIGYTALHMACYHGSSSIIKCLLEDDRFDPNQRTEDGDTPLHVVCYGYFRVRNAYNHGYAAKDRYEECIRVLLDDTRTNINLQGSPIGKAPTGVKPIILMTSWGLTSSLKLLLSRDDCDPTSRSTDSQPLPLCVACNANAKESAEILLGDPRVDPNTIDNENMPPLFLACDKNNCDIIQMLLSDPRVNLVFGGKTFVDVLLEKKHTYAIKTLAKKFPQMEILSEASMVLEEV